MQQYDAIKLSMNIVLYTHKYQSTEVQPKIYFNKSCYEKLSDNLIGYNIQRQPTATNSNQQPTPRGKQCLRPCNLKRSLHTRNHTAAKNLSIDTQNVRIYPRILANCFNSPRIGLALEPTLSAKAITRHSIQPLGTMDAVGRSCQSWSPFHAYGINIRLVFPTMSQAQITHSTDFGPFVLNHQPRIAHRRPPRS